MQQWADLIGCILAGLMLAAVIKRLCVRWLKLPRMKTTDLVGLTVCYTAIAVLGSWKAESLEEMLTTIVVVCVTNICYDLVAEHVLARQA